MRATVRLILLFLLFYLFTGLAAAQTSIESALRAVDSLYAAGSYSRAELEARRLLENDLLSDSVRIAAEQWVAFALVAQERPALAKEHFITILQRQPAHELDPILTSPKILAVFNDARATFLASRAQEVNPSTDQKGGVPKGITFRTILFPGWEQWYHGRTPTGPILVGAGVATLGAGITFEFLRRSARQDYLAATTPEGIASTYDTYNRYRKAEAYSFIAFAVVYAVSEIEVFLHNSPVTVSPAPVTSEIRGTGLTVQFALP